MGIREALNRKPWLGWTLAGVFLVASVVLYLRLSGRNATYSVERLSEDVTIRCAETGDEWTMQRGLFERELRRRPGLLNMQVGIVNPNTGKPTGFPYDKNSWEETVKRINAEKRKYDPTLKDAPAEGAEESGGSPQGS